MAARFTLDAARLVPAQVDSDLHPTFQLAGAFGSQVSPTSLVQEQEEIDEENQAAIANYELQQSLFPGVAFPPPVLQPDVNRNRPGFWQISLISTFQIPLYDYGTRATAHQAANAQIDSDRVALANEYASVDADEGDRRA